MHTIAAVSEWCILYPTDDDLLVTMASRLGQVERELLSARREIIEKDQHIRLIINNAVAIDY